MRILVLTSQLRFAVFYVIDQSTLSLLARCCVSLRCHRRESHISSGVRHGSDLSPEATLLVTCHVRDLVFVSEG